MANISIQVGDEEFAAELASEASPQTVRAILAALPIQATAMTWGDEIYFEIPVAMPLENGRTTVRKGDLGYWPSGRCFCLFYGMTPMSNTEDEIVPASAVNVIGTVARPDGLKRHVAGEQVTIRRAD